MAPDRLLGRIININQNMAPMAANAKSILYGDFKKYLIRDVMDVTLFRMTGQRAYTLKGQVGFVAFAAPAAICWMWVAQSRPTSTRPPDRPPMNPGPGYGWGRTQAEPTWQKPNPRPLRLMLLQLTRWSTSSRSQTRQHRPARPRTRLRM